MSSSMRTGALWLLACCSLAATAAEPGPSWGAIATADRSWGTAFNHSTRTAAEAAARAQCDRTAGRQGACAVRAYFDRSCGAVALGNYGEWAVATASTSAAAEKTAVGQCDGHLPTQPCRTLVSVCSPR
ncbi:MAG: DUF4189 domain-containing protein [Comamonadaceae bacterium]|nr:MAG: DUF4189 domain-containing protein [Comamonadaceae bacterium]